MRSTAREIKVDDVARILAPRLRAYRRRSPVYQAMMLACLQRLWRGPHARLLDIGGGTGVIAQCVSELFDVDQVVSIDVADRYCADLDIGTAIFDGRVLPFADRSFDAAMLNNVLHHAPRAARGPLMAEIARVVDGPIYIKDHVAAGPLDDLRLFALDLVGNIPFGGMLSAAYLTQHEWDALGEAAGFRIAERAVADYRTGAMRAAFPNRLELSMRFERISGR